jgi:hypothetical protein
VKVLQLENIYEKHYFNALIAIANYKRPNMFPKLREFAITTSIQYRIGVPIQ